MLGLKLKVPPQDFAAAARARKLLTIPAGDNVVRLLPPLIITEEELAEGVRRLDAACADLEDALVTVEEGRRRMNAALQAEPTRHFLDLLDLPTDELRAILDARKAMKAARVKGERAASRPLAGKTLAMIFDKPSTRTRVSFDLAMRELGGETIMLTGDEMQLGRGETIADTARVLSRYVDAIMIRILSHDDLEELARYATVPVINGLTKRSHPCQVMADIMTFEEHRGPIGGRKVAWSGDYNNVLSSWIHAAQRFGFPLDIACPKELQPPPQRIEAARAGGAKVILREDPEAAVAGAAAVISDCWVSMGDEDEAPPPQPARALSGQRRADAPRRRRTRSSCIACRPIAARKSPTR